MEDASTLTVYGSLFMRLPPLFFMDKILTLSFGLANVYSETVKFSILDSFESPNITLHEEQDEISIADSLSHFNDNQSYEGDLSMPPDFLPFFRSALTHQILKILALTSAFICCLIAFTLCWKNLLSLYSIVLSIICVILSYQSNVGAINYFFSSNELEQTPSMMQMLLSFKILESFQYSTYVLIIASNYIFQAALYFVFVTVQVGLDDDGIAKKALIWAFLLPSWIMFLTFSKDTPLIICRLCAAVPFLITNSRILRGVPYALGEIISGIEYSQEVVNNFGFHALMDSEWSRLRIPSALRSFWLLRAANIVVHSMASQLSQQDTESDTVTMLYLLDSYSLYSIFKETMTQGCDTVLAVLGMTSVVSYISHYIGVFFQILLQSDDEEDRSMGTVTAIIFIVLAEQSGLTVLENEKRYIRLCRNYCLLFTTILYFIHNMVNPVLMSLSASRHPAIKRHIRALSVCAMLIILPAILLYTLWSFFSLSTWLLAVTAFCIQVIIKTSFSVVIYGLFLADAYYSLFLENLDDYVYYIKAAGNTFEFIMGIVLFFNGLYIYFFESGGAIRALMMCIHAYINIWCEAKNGWSAFIKRRDAVGKIAGIPDATPQQLEEHDDLCSICFQPLMSAKITRCRHFFHEICLRKWLYVQDTCPMCHTSLYILTDTTSNENTQDVVAVLDEILTDEEHEAPPEEIRNLVADVIELPQFAAYQAETEATNAQIEPNENRHLPTTLETAMNLHPDTVDFGYELDDQLDLDTFR